MNVKLLGSSAGGGLPQWNCTCVNCLKASAGEIPSRTQSCVAFSADGKSWFLVNASPDIRLQLGQLPTFEVENGRKRVFEAVLLSNADLDHTLGLLVAREGGPQTVYSSEEVRRTVSEALHFDRILGAFSGISCGVDWRKLDATPLELQTFGGSPTGLRVTALMLGGSAPRYDPRVNLGESDGPGHACAFIIEDLRSGANLVCALDVPGPNKALIDSVVHSDLTIFDGTFWTSLEMIDLGFSARTSEQMGHWPISGDQGSMKALGPAFKGKTKIVYSHLNNTNPVLDPGSGQRKILQENGFIVGEDGMEWTL